jgi:hypothetical protein
MIPETIEYVGHCLYEVSPFRLGVMFNSVHSLHSELLRGSTISSTFPISDLLPASPTYRKPNRVSLTGPVPIRRERDDDSGTCGK